ncbi:MAG: DNA topoisomerase IV subunit A [Alphaproteobacteria bacterium]|nr:DNA topoisomerase IV subunit A [Alphaproteobacteria bacterium]
MARTRTAAAPPPPPDIRPVPLLEALSERYLSYALSTIMARSLPDVRDGLKPVHRRILYAMQQLRLDPEQGFKKCAKVVGDVMGRFHPHGDTAIYDALVRLAQGFATRYPMIDGQGNFGNVDGDNAAAMRYTEARLTEAAVTLMAGIDEDAVDLRPSYDGSDSEPVVLPAGFPNLLANGAIGIAVGMATSIPPHNADEICDALIHLLDHAKATFDKLLELMPGPDFPTGGILVEPRESIKSAYESGRGSFRLRARWTVEKLNHGLYQVVVTEIPYQVQKARLIERIADLLINKKLMLLNDVRDESAEDVRVVLEPKSRAVDPAMLMESLFRASELEVRISLNMNVLDRNNVPSVMDLRAVLQAYLDHRDEVLMRRTQYRLGVIERRLEVLDGYLIAYLNLDEVIAIIRAEEEPKPVLIRRFKLTDGQAEAILNMRLRALRKLEEIAIKRERKALTDEKKDQTALLNSPETRAAVVKGELRDVKKRFGKGTALGKRRTEIGAPPAVIDVPPEALIEREPVTVLLSAKGWIRALKGHGDNGEIKLKEGDGERFSLAAETTDKLLLLGTNGRFYTLGCDKLPRGRGFGDAVRLMIELENTEDIVAMLVHRVGQKLLVAASDGRGFVVESDAVVAQTRSGKQVLNLGDGAEAARVVVAEGDTVAVVGDNRKLLLFPLAEVPELARGRGVILQRFKSGGLADVKVFRIAEGLTWRSGERTRTETDLRAWQGERAQTGRIAPTGFARSNRFG